MIKPTLAVMAAGLGQRYGGLKQMDSIGGDDRSGYILLEYAIYDAVRSGFGRIVILLREPMLDDFKKKYGQRIARALESRGIGFDFVFQPALPEIDQALSFREKMGGTGHAALCFAQKINEPFVIINADDFYGRDSFVAINSFFNRPDYDPRGSKHALAGFHLKNVVSPNGAVARGICEVSADNFLQSITEREKIETRPNGKIVYLSGATEHELNPKTYASMNFWGFNATIFSHLAEGFERYLDEIKKNREPKKEFYLPSVIGDALAKKEISVEIIGTREKWFGMTYPADRQAVSGEIKKLVAKGCYPEKLWA